MPTVDELVLKLSVDNTEFRKTLDGIQEQLRKFSEQSTRQTTAVERGVTAAADGFTKLRNEVLGLLAAFVSTRALVDFTKRLTEMDTALGRASAASGTFFKDYAAWQGAARAMGGVSDTFTKALGNIQSAIGAYEAGEQSPFLAMMERMHVQIARTRDGAVDFQETMKRIADWAARETNIPLRNFVLGRLGFSPDDIALLIRGRGEMEKFFEIAKRYAATPADEAAARERTRAFYELSAAIEQTGRTILTALTPQLDAAARAFTTWVNTNKEWIALNVINTVERLWPVVRELATGTQKVADAFGGWANVASILIGIKMASWLLGVADGVLKLGAALIGLEKAATAVGLLRWLVGTFGAGAMGAYFGFTVGKGEGETPEHERQEEDRILREGTEVEKRMILERRARLEAARRAQQGGGGVVGGATLPTVDAEMNSTRRAFLETLAAGESSDYSSRNPTSSAYGRYQFIDSTREQAQRETGISGYDPVSQDRLGWYWADKTYRKNTGRDLEADFRAGRYSDITAALRSEWPSLPGGSQQNTTEDQFSSRAQSALRRNDVEDVQRKQIMDRLREIGRTPAPGPVVAPSQAVPPPDPSLRGAIHPSAFQPGVTNNTTTTSSATTHINGPITINTQATDADGIARGLKPAIQRNSIVAQADYGLA